MTHSKQKIRLNNTGKELEQLEDPLVCKTCGNNNITILKRKKELIYCLSCKQQNQWLAKSEIPNPKLVKTLKHWENRFEEWKKGTDLKDKELRQLEETIYSTYYFNNPDKRRKILNYCEKMGVEVNE